LSRDAHILSLGAGVQSSTLALMAAMGETDTMPVAAVFADTQGEPTSVYTWLRWLDWKLPFVVVQATHGNLAADSIRLRTSRKSGNTYLSPSLPVFTISNGKKGMMQRQCTRDYKISVVRRASREIMDALGADRCIQWIGISTDEAHRMKPSGDPRFENVWPLIDKGMSRDDCLRWMEAKGFPRPPRSACVFCPYHSDAEWLRLKTEEPKAFAAAVEYEKQLTAAVHASTALEADAVFLHASRIPLDRVIFVEKEIVAASQFGNECEGMCGV